MFKKIFLFAVIGVLGVASFASAATLAQRLSGSILLQVQANGEAWYVNPTDNLRYYMKDGAVAYQMMRNFGLGITDIDLTKIPSVSSTSEMNKSSSVCTSNSTANRLKGKILLQVQQHGEAWYIYPKTCRSIYMKDGAAAYEIMRFLGLGITNSDLALIPISKAFETAPAPTPAPAEVKPMTRGFADPDFTIEVYDTNKANDGTTLLADNHNTEKPRIIEVNMLGEIIWEYDLPLELKKYTNPGFDVELLSNNNVLFVLPGNGVYEINRNKIIVWSYKTTKISHDADRLPNGNTIFVFGNIDTVNDAQVTEVNQGGQIVWSWYARDHYNTAPYNTISKQGWTHTNAVSRLSNGNTLISPRNFNMVIEVNQRGETVKTIGENLMAEQHDPVLLENGDYLFANHATPEKAIEIDSTGKVIWEYTITNSQQYPVRDVNRLPNGNTLITSTTKIFEVTPGKEIVWSFSIKDTSRFVGTVSAGLGFYKAERILK
ncbi:MAG: aryl-sulfate sulfotransferase [Janthinobacterium sp.]|jgi:hypothetical protein